MEHPLMLERRGSGELRITFGRPAARNALDLETLQGLDVALASAADAPDVRVVVITGAGEHFSAGADLKEFVQLSDAELSEVLIVGQQVFRRIERLGKPVIARVDGVALGGGFELCLACTHIVASDRARFALPEVRLGLVPGYGGTQRLIRSVGRHRALRIMLGGQLHSSEEIGALGLLEVAPMPADQLDAAVAALVTQLAANAPSAMASVIASVSIALDGPIADGLALETERAIAACTGPDGRRGIAAFVAKEPPEHPGVRTGDDGDERSMR
jgi:enoyl-CoA hydratase